MSLGFVPSSSVSPAGAAVALAPALGANVLVLNKFYQAVRVINVRRAFSLLCRELAEVIHIETDEKGQSRWQNLDFAEWTELSARSEEHTSELQSLAYLVCRLLLEKKNENIKI